MITLRRVLEKWARGKRLKRNIYVNGQRRPIIVSPDAQLKYLKGGAGAFDQDLIRIAEVFLSEDSVVWDVGANVGVFTFAAASVAKNGTVVSVEADIWLADVLGRTRHLPEYADLDIRIVPVALSRVDGVAVFQIASRGRASNSLEEAGGRSQMGGVREKQYVPSLRIDTLLSTLPKPDFVKIDVEGAEGFVLEGGHELLSQVRPFLYVEVGLTTREAVRLRMEKNNYVEFSPEGEAISDELMSNVFFVPVEKRSDFELNFTNLK